MNQREQPEQSPADMEAPLASPADTCIWGSDMVAEAIRNVDLEYVALNPGASFRGLHDSLVNHNGNRRPQGVRRDHHAQLDRDRRLFRRRAAGAPRPALPAEILLLTGHYEQRRGVSGF